MINPNSDRAGGWPTPLKNDGLRQLGWWFFPRLMDKSSSHVPVTTKQFPILPWPLWGDPIFSCAQGGWRWLMLEPPVPSLLMSGMKVWLFFNPNGVYTYIYIYIYLILFIPPNSAANCAGYSAVSLLKNWPDDEIAPAICWWLPRGWVHAHANWETAE